VSPTRDVTSTGCVTGSSGTLRDHSITRQLEPIQFICVITAGSHASMSQEQAGESIYIYLPAPHVDGCRCLVTICIVDRFSR
jgi:hypothetical protein